MVEVAKATSLPKGPIKRKIQVENLRNEGKFEHRVAALKAGSGKLTSKRLPKTTAEGNNYTHGI